MVSDACSYSTPERPPHGISTKIDRDTQADFPLDFCLELVNNTKASMIASPIDKKHICSSDSKGVKTG